MSQVNTMQPKIFPLDEMIVGGYDYGEKTTYTTHHLGVDYKAVFVPLMAPCDGEIVNVFTGTEGGLTIWFRPAGETTILRFLHLSEYRCRKGDLVTQGKVIAITGDSGKSEGAHLHHDIWKKSVTLRFSDTINPHTYYPKVGG